MRRIGRHKIDLLPRFDRGRVSNGPEVGNSPIGVLAGGNQRTGGDRSRTADPTHAGDHHVAARSSTRDLGQDLIHRLDRWWGMPIPDRHPRQAKPGGLGVGHQLRVAPTLKLAIFDQEHEQIDAQAAETLQVRPRVTPVDEAGVSNRLAPLPGQDGQPQPTRPIVADQRQVDPVNVDGRVHRTPWIGHERDRTGHSA